MAVRKTLALGAASLLLIWSSAPAFSADTAIKSPAQVKRALGTLNRVVDHTRRLIAAKNYAQLVHENNEFEQGSKALENGIADEPASFKSEVEPLLQKADMDAHHIADAANAQDDTKLASAHAELSTSVKAILAAFPSEVQPPPPNRATEKHEEEKNGMAK